MKINNEILGVSFNRFKDSATGNDEHSIVLHLTKKIPSLGYGSKEIRKLLKQFDKPPELKW